MTTHDKAQKAYCKRNIQKLARIVKLSKKAKHILDVLFHNERQVKIFLTEAYDALKCMQTRNDARIQLDKTIAKLERELRDIRSQVSSYAKASAA